MIDCRRAIGRTPSGGHASPSAEHFTVDGTPIEAWASHKSFQPKGERNASDDDDPGNPAVSFRGKRARLAYQGHVLTQDRNGLVVAAQLTQTAASPGETPRIATTTRESSSRSFASGT